MAKKKTAEELAVAHLAEEADDDPRPWDREKPRARDLFRDFVRHNRSSLPPLDVEHFAQNMSDFCELSSATPDAVHPNVDLALARWKVTHDKTPKSAGRTSEARPSDLELALLDLLEQRLFYENYIEATLWPAFRKFIDLQMLGGIDREAESRLKKAKKQISKTAAARSVEARRAVSEPQKLEYQKTWQELCVDGVPERHRTKSILAIHHPGASGKRLDSVLRNIERAVAELRTPKPETGSTAKTEKKA